jgi:RNA polymerase sigma-70 factor (ECF subfamily)
MGTPTPAAARFETTHWSLVVSAGATGHDTSAQSALETLCRTYWYPLYAYVRRKGHQPDDAADLVQGFFASLLERRAFAAADPHRGRFRAFLLASLDHHLLNQHRHDHAQKRGGHQSTLALDFTDGERRYSLEPSHDLTPDRIFDQRWALTLIDAALARLRTEYQSRGKATLFEALSPLLNGDPPETYATLASQLNMTEGALKVTVHRLRQRCRDLLRQQVAQTLTNPAEIDQELRHLFGSV